MRSPIFCFVCALASLPLGALAAESVTLPKKVPFAKGIDVPAAVQAECTLPERTAGFLNDFASSHFTTKQVDTVSPQMPGKVLTMQITSLVGTGGGAWSGAKSVTTEGTLYENGKVIGTFKAARYSGGGAFGGYKGTCSILGRCIKEIGKDVSEWMKAPTMNAKLGDAK